MRFATILAAFTVALAAQDTATVEGIVVNRVTGSGIGGATVRVYIKTNRYEIVTGEAGTFRITGIQPGDYTASVEKSGYFASSKEMFRPPFHLESGKDAVRLRFELIPPGKLRGRVIGLDKNPAPNVEVVLGPDFDKSATTDESGAFVFDHLMPGSYTLVARPKGAKPAATQDGSRMEIVPTYFPSVVDRSLAESIPLQAGADESGYQIELQTAPVYRVRGVALDADGKPAAKVAVELLSKFQGGHDSGMILIGGGPFTIGSGVAGAAPVPGEPVVTGEDGVFEFPSVLRGDWILRAESGTLGERIRQRSLMVYGGAAISVGRRDLDDVRIQLSKPFELRGSVELSDGTAAPNSISGLSVLLSGEDGFRGDRGRRLEDGTLRFEIVAPGRYRIQPLVVSNKYYAAAVRLGNSDVTGQAAELTPVSPPIRIILKPAAAIHGTVEKGEGTTVVLVPQKLAAGDTGWTEQCGPGGTFEFTGIPPGDYNAIALDPVNWREIADASYLRSMTPSATSVRLEEGSAAFVQLKVVH